VTDSNHKKTQATQPRSTLQYPKIARKNKHDATISKNHKKKQAQPRARATHNQHNEDRRYNIALNLLLVATGCKVHCGQLCALWVARCIVGAWVFRDKKVAHVLQRHGCQWVETCRTHPTVYPAKAAFNKKRTLFTSTLDLELRKKCVFVTLLIQHVMHMHHILICGLSFSTIAFHVTSYTAPFLERSYWTWNVYFDFLYNFCL